MKKVICTSCGIEIEIKNDTYYHGIKRNPDNPKFYCKECYRILKAKRLQEYYRGLTSDERKERHKRIREKWFEKTIDERKKTCRKISESKKRYYDNMTDEERKKLSEKGKEVWDSIPEDKKVQIVEKHKKFYKDHPEAGINISNKAKQRWNNKSEEEKEEWALIRKKWWDELPEEDKKRKGKRHSEWYKNTSEEYKLTYSQSKKEWWNNLSNEQKHLIKTLRKQQWTNYSQEKKNEISNRLKFYYDNLSEEDKKIFVHKTMSSVQGRNKLHQKFENSISEYIKNNNLDIKSEYLTDENHCIHPWDYAIFQDGNLIALIDLDGSYFHADECDYDGIHSKLNNDIRRFKSKPVGIKHFIILENNFDESLKWVINHLLISYDNYIKVTLRYLRSIPFPHPSYSDIELMKSWDKLVRMNVNDKYVNIIYRYSRLGDRITHHFHPSLWKDIVPLWNDDDQLREWIMDGTVYQNHLNKNKILQGLTPKFVSAAQAKIRISRGEDIQEGPGWLLGAISLGLKYPYPLTVEDQIMVDFLKKYKVKIEDPK